MQIPFLQLTVIISGAVASPLAQFYPDDSFDIAISDIDNSGVVAPEPYEIAEVDKPSQAPAQTPPETLPNVPQPGDPIFRQKPQPKPQLKPKVPTKIPDENNPEEELKNINQPFECGAGKSGACCVGGTRDGVTTGCIRFLAYDDWCQKPEWFKCCKKQAAKDISIEKGLALEDHLREDCEDPKDVLPQPQWGWGWGGNLLRMIIPQGGGIESGVSFPKGVWIPNQ